MRILIEMAASGPFYVRSGWTRAFVLAGHTVHHWWPERQSAFDAFNEFGPDLFIGTTYSVDRAVDKCLRARPELNAILFASAWGPLADNLDPVQFPIVRVSDEEKRVLGRLKEETGKPDFVFLHSHGEWLEGSMSGWQELGIRPVGVLNGFDAVLYRGARKRPELACDASMAGGFWGYKGRNLERFILPLCHPSSGLDVKIFGNSPWPTHCYLGRCSDEDNRDLFLSSTVSMNVSEPHSTSPAYSGDVVERPYKILGVGGFCASDYVAEARSLFTEDELVMAKTPEEFEHLVRHYVANPNERGRFMKAGQKKVLAQHTYFDRVAQFFTELEMPDEAKNVLRVKSEFIAENYEVPA